MPTEQFLDFFLVFSNDVCTFVEFEGGPALWVIDAGLFAGQPLLTVTTRTFQHGTVKNTSVVLSGARYPGTALPGDLSVEITFFEGDENRSQSQSVSFKPNFGNAEFGWEFDPIDTDPQTQTDGFLEWLKRRAAVTAQVPIEGPIALPANGASLDFGPAATATLTAVPGIFTISGASVCSANLAGVEFSGSSVAWSAAGGGQTTVVVEAEFPFSVPIPAETPVGSLTPVDAAWTVTLEAGETRQSVTFSPAKPGPAYVLELLAGVTDLDGGPARVTLTTGAVSFDLSSTPPKITFGMSGRFASAFLLSGGIALRVPSTPAESGSAGVAMAHDGANWTVERAGTRLLGMVPPLGDAMTEPIDSGATLSLIPPGTRPQPGGPSNWLILGNTQPGDVRLHLTPLAFQVTRASDLLLLRFQLEGLAARAIDGQPPSLVIEQQGQAGTLTVIFPPQHMAEEAYYAEAGGFEQGGDPGPGKLAPPPIPVRLAGETRLVFLVPAHQTPKPLTLDNLLDWSSYSLSPSLPGDTDNRCTSVELPYRLMLSPGPDAAFAVGNSAADSGPAALWQARLGTRRSIPGRPGSFFTDERRAPPVTIVGSPDFVRGQRPPDTDTLPFSARDSLTRSDRYDLAERGLFRPQRLQMNRLTLSALGGSLDSRIAWDADTTGLTNGNDVAEWRHVAAQGRDAYSRVVRRGVLFPFRHRASWVKITERKFTGGLDSTNGNPAYLIERDFVVVTEPVVKYRPGDPDRPRDLPFTEIEVLTRTTPTLNPPEGIDNTLRAFWLKLGASSFRFQMRAIDSTGQVVAFEASAIFVKDDSTSDPALMQAVRDAYDRPPHTSYTLSALAGQKVALATPRQPGDTTLEVETLKFMSAQNSVPTVRERARKAAVADAATQAPFPIPRAMWEASIAGGSMIGAVTGPPVAVSSDVITVPHGRGVVLAVAGASPQPVPQAVFDAWNAQRIAGSSLGPPTGFAFPVPGGQVFRFQSGSITLSDTAAATVGPPITSDLRRYFQPQDNFLQIMRPETGTTAIPIIGGAGLFKRMLADLAAASGSSDFIYITSWHCNVDFETLPGDPSSTLRALLSAKAAAGVQIRALLWAGDPVPGGPGFPQATVPWQLVKEYARRKTARLVNEPAVKFINQLSAAGNDTAALLDNRHLLAGSHHQKILVIGTGGKLIAYIGGMEFNRDRIPPALADEAGSPLFDISVRLQDGAAFPVLLTFISRWTRHPGKTGALLRGESLGMPLPASGPQTVQVTHTFGRGFPFPNAVQTASTAVANGIKSARQFIYMEDQYFVGSSKLTAAINDAFSSNPNLVGIVVIAAEDSVNDLPDLAFRRREFFRPIVTAFPGRFLVFERLGDDRTTTGERAYIHSKLLIADDEAALIGSVNSSRRSWFHDSEISATITDTNGPGGVEPGARGGVRDFRCNLWAEHLKIDAALLGSFAFCLTLWQAAISGAFVTVGGKVVDVRNTALVRAYDVNALVPRWGNNVPPAVLDAAWKSVEDPS